jgi:crotonobetainyl-CoA:carnitine CoA-transferase CaiB-like acyl-CoA transferase
VAAIVPKLSATPGKIRHSGTKIGSDTRAVLTKIAGLSAGEIERLEAASVIYCEGQGRTRRSPEKKAVADE